MTLIHLEDDALYAELIKAELEDLAKSSRVDLKVETVKTERKFTSLLNSFIEEGDAFLLDVMVRWSFPEDDDQEQEQGEIDYYNAGIRCAKLILENASRIPSKTIILYTVLRKEELLDEFLALEKVKGTHNLYLVTKSEDVSEVWQKLINEA